MVVNFNLLINFVIFSDKLFYSILFDHIEDVPLCIKVLGVYIHVFKL
jgi:hypothetical protein